MKKLLFLIATIFISIQLAFSQGNMIDAMIDARYYYNKKKYKEAVAIWQKLADEGSVDAQYWLGICYSMGRGVGKDKKKAAYWYEKAANQGDADMQYKIGFAYKWGRGVLKNDEKAIYWLEKSANKGNVSAQYCLGECYYEGIGVTKDYSKAAYWYSKAADNGLKSAKHALVYNELRQYLSKEVSVRDKDNLVPQGNDISSLPNNKKIMELSGDDSFSSHKSLLDTDIPTTKYMSDNTFAVIIGNENYRKAVCVPFAINDANIFAAYCERTLGLPKENIRICTDATYGTIVDAVDWIKRVSSKYKGQLNVVFYYSGHGIPDDNTREAYILPVDADGLNLRICYPLKELYSELAAMEAHRVLILLDACFSGAVKGDGMIVQAKGVAIKPHEDAIGGNVVVLSAAKGKETAYPYKSEQHGLFTYYLLKKMHETKGDVTLGELSRYVQEEVGKKAIVVNGKEQTPMVIVSDGILDKWQTMRLIEK